MTNEKPKALYKSEIPKITIPVFDMEEPADRLMPTPVPVVLPFTTLRGGTTYVSNLMRALPLKTVYQLLVSEVGHRAYNLLLGTGYNVTTPPLIDISKDLLLKTEVSLEMMNWFIENNLVLKVEPVLTAHYGLLFSTFVKLKTDYTATLPEFKTYESDLLLKIENAVELVGVIERAKNLGLSVEVGLVPSIGVTTNIYAGTRVEVELSFVEEILMTIEGMLKTSYEAKMMIIPVTVSNELETIYNVLLHKYSSEIYSGYSLTDYLDKSAEKTLGLKVVGRTAHITEMYPGYSLTDFLDTSAEKTVGLEVEGRTEHITEMYSGYSEPVLIPPKLRLVTGYNVSLS